MFNKVPNGCSGTVYDLKWSWHWSLSSGWKYHYGDYCGDATANDDVVPMPVMDRPVFEIDISPMTAMTMLLVAVAFMALTVLVCCRSKSLRKKAVYKMVDLTDLESENEMEVRPMNRVK